VMITVFVQIVIGIVNVLLLTPIWLQILHLLVGDVFWILLVLVSAELMLEDSSARVLAGEPNPTSVEKAFV
jgi:heme a synthase